MTDERKAPTMTVEIFDGKVRIIDSDWIYREQNEIEKLLVLRDALDKTLFWYEKDYIRQHGTKNYTTDLDVPTEEQINQYHKKPTNDEQLPTTTENNS
jgi:hypothetical protein